MASLSEIIQLCRLCLVKDDVNIPIFDDFDTIRQIPLKISSCLPVKVARGDNLPKKICDRCSSKLDLCYNFWNSTAQVEKILLSMVEKQNQVPEAAIPEPLILKVEPAESLEDTHSQICEPPVPNPISVKAEVEATADSIENEAEQPLAKRPRRSAAIKTQITPESDDDAAETTTEDVAEMEDGIDDPDVPDMSVDIDDVKPGPSGLNQGSTDSENASVTRSKLELDPNCNITVKEEDITDTSDKEVKRRTRKKRSKVIKKKKEKKITKRTARPAPVDLDDPIVCDQCNQTYKNHVAFALHSIVHSEDDKFVCHMCELRSTSRYHMEMHVRAHEGTTGYKCDICNKAFTVSTNAVEHKYYHTGEKPFQCEICGKHFMYSRFLASHRRTQHWEIMTGTPLVKYDCTLCNKHYTSSSGLKRHNLRKHSPEGANHGVLCDTCGKRISSMEKLKFHMRIHTGYKPFVCEVCQKAFTEKERLKEHMRVHTGEKPFVCKYCGRCFTQRSPLKIHERTHTGEQPYTCRLCGRGFVSKSSMDAHMKSCPVMHLPEDNTNPKYLVYSQNNGAEQTSFTCYVMSCNKQFDSKEALKSHLVTHGFDGSLSDEVIPNLMDRKRFTQSLNQIINNHNKDGVNTVPDNN